MRITCVESATAMVARSRNAGMLWGAAAWGATADGLEAHLAANCVGPHLLSLLLLPALRAAAEV